MKSEDDAERIRRIGAPPDKVIVSGNIKYDKEVVEQETEGGGGSITGRIAGAYVRGRGPYRSRQHA